MSFEDILDLLCRLVLQDHAGACGGTQVLECDQILFPTSLQEPVGTLVFSSNIILVPKSLLLNMLTVLVSSLMKVM